MDELHPVTRENIYQRTAEVTDMRKKPTIIEVNHMLLDVY
jgi:hypothetical protein